MGIKPVVWPVRNLLSDGSASAAENKSQPPAEFGRKLESFAEGKSTEKPEIPDTLPVGKKYKTVSSLNNAEFSEYLALFKKNSGYLDLGIDPVMENDLQNKNEPSEDPYKVIDQINDILYGTVGELTVSRIKELQKFISSATKSKDDRVQEAIIDIMGSEEIKKLKKYNVRFCRFLNNEITELYNKKISENQIISQEIFLFLNIIKNMANSTLDENQTIKNGMINSTVIENQTVKIPSIYSRNGVDRREVEEEISDEIVEISVWDKK